MYNIHYPRLTYAYPCLKSVNILCLVIKAEDLRHTALSHTWSTSEQDFMNSSTKQNSKASSFYAGIQRFLLRRGGGGAPKMKDNFVFQGVGVHGLFLFSVTLHCKFFICLKFQGEWWEQPPPPLQPSLTTP